MSASNTDKFKKLTNNFSTTLSAPIVGASDTSMSLSSTTNLPTDTGIVLVIDRVNSSGTATPTSREYVKGTVSGSNIINLVRGVGNSTAQAHSTGAVVEQVVDQTTINDLMDGLLVQHNQDGTHGAVTATSVSAPSITSTGDLQLRSTSLETIASERFFDHVASGCVWSADSAGTNTKASMTSGVVYIGGKRVAVSAVTSRTFTASKDTYIDVDNTGTITYTEVSNNAASPSLTANSIRLGIIVTGASNIANSGSVNQGQETMVLPIASSVPYAVTDSLGNLICPRDPNRKILGYRQIVASFSTASTSATQITGLSCPVIIPSNRKIKVSVFVWAITSTSNVAVATSIWDGTVNSGTQIVQADTGNMTGQDQSVSPFALTTPTTTSKTYNAGVVIGSGTVTVNAKSVAPAYIMVELV